MNFSISRRECLMAAAAAAAIPSVARSQTQVTKIVVPFAAGGGLDACARMVADGLNAQSQTARTVVENRAGAGGNIGTEAVINSRPDGRTVLMASFNNIMFAPHLYANLSYDPIADLAPVCCVWATEALAIVNPKNLPVSSLTELVAYAKSSGRTLNMGSSGTGSGNHIIGELFQKVAGVRFNHIPYKGAGPAMVDLLGGHLDLVFDSLPSGLAHAKQGVVRAIGITGSKRHVDLPNVPSYVESGFEAASVTAWGGLLVPKGTPRQEIDSLARAVQAVGPTQAAKDRMRQLGLDWLYMDPAAFAAHIAKENARWNGVFKDLDIKVS